MWGTLSKEIDNDLKYHNYKVLLFHVQKARIEKRAAYKILKTILCFLPDKVTPRLQRIESINILMSTNVAVEHDHIKRK